jgi:hypothetical protein
METGIWWKKQYVRKILQMMTWILHWLWLRLNFCVSLLTRIQPPAAGGMIRPATKDVNPPGY